MEIKKEKYQFITQGAELKVKVAGMMKEDDVMPYLEDYRTIISSMPRKEVVELDFSSLSVVFQSLLDDMVDILKMYQNDFKSISIIYQKSNILLRNQIVRCAKQINLNYTMTEVE